MHVVNIDAEYYLAKTTEKCLQNSARAKKNMYMQAFRQQRCQFLHFVASVDELIDVESAATLKRIVSRIEKN